MVMRTSGARGVGGGASLIGVSVSPTVSTLGGSIGQERKFDLALLPEEEDPRSEGRPVFGVDSDNHRSGLLGVPRISVRVKVLGLENRARFVVEDCLPDILEEFLFILGEEPQW